MNYENILHSFVQLDRRYIIMTAENRASIRNIPKLIPENFLDVGIAEQSMVGIAAGLALCGRIPVIHALSAFLTMRAYEFIRTDVGISSLPVKLVGAIPGILSEANGPTHQAVEDIALMRTIPTMQIFSPADEEDMLYNLPSFLKSNVPCYIRYNNMKAIIKHKQLPLGAAEVFDDGRDAAIIVHGVLFNQAFIAKEILEAKNISVRLINLRSLNPLDISTLLKAFNECKIIVTVEDHYLYGGLYSLILELADKYDIHINTLPIALMKKYFTPALFDAVIKNEGFSGEQIAEKIELHYNKKKGSYYAEWSSVQ
ncbi:MAG: transketolase C-terminal domain-containing protein [bacterium]